MTQFIYTEFYNWFNEKNKLNLQGGNDEFVKNINFS